MSIASWTELEHSIAESRSAAGHHIRVVAENRKRVRRQRARGHMERRRRKLARDLVHVGDHQQQALRRSEGGGQRPGLQGAMNRAGGAALTLHFDHAWHRAPDIGSCLRRPTGPPIRPSVEEGVMG